MRTYVGATGLTLMLSIASLARAEDWPQWRGLNRDGKSPETGLLERWPDSGPEQLWVVKGLGQGFASVSVADGLIYTTGMVRRKGVLSAVGLDGRLKWKKEYGPEWTDGPPGVRTTPTVDSGLLYLMSGKGRLACFDAKTGTEKWGVDAVGKYGGKIPSWGIAESPLVIDRLVIGTPGGRNASVVAFDKRTGKPKWQSRGLSDVSAYCSAMTIERARKRQVVTMVAKTIVGLDAATGRILWRHPHQTKYDVHAVTPLYYSGHIYATSGYGTGGVMLRLARDGRGVTERWRNRDLDNHHGGVVLVKGYIYGSTYGGSWVCLRGKTGRVMYNTRGIGKGSVIYADGMLYCYGERGTLALVKASPEAFNVVSQVRIQEGGGQHWAHPAIADGRLYIRHGDALMAFDIRGPRSQ